MRVDSWSNLDQNFAMSTVVVPEPSTYRHIEPYGAEGPARLAYLDQSLFVAHHDGLPPGFWEKHPRVDRVADDIPEDGAKFATRVWPTDYRRASLGEYPDLPARMDRPADVLLWGWFNPGHDFWCLHPDVEAVEYMYDHGIGPEHPEAWQAKLWLRVQTGER
jgi:hypothetical protein